MSATDRIGTGPLTSICVWSSNDAADWLEVSNDEGLNRFSISGYRQKDLQAAQLFIENQKKVFSETGMGNFAVRSRETQELIGNCLIRFAAFDDAPETNFVEIGYRLARAHWGRGCATEIAGLLKNYGLQQLGLRQVVGFIVPQNHASRRVLQKAGFEFERNAFFKGHEVEIYSAGDSKS